MAEHVASPQRSGEPLGLAEAAMRSDYVNGVAAALIKEMKRWARERGCRELASEESERVVFFRKPLA